MKVRILVFALACWISACNGQAVIEDNPVKVDEPSAEDHVETAEPELFRPSFEACLDKAGGVTPDIQACIEEEFVFHDDRLKSAYKVLQQSLDDEKKNALEASQRTWLAKRETDCAWDARNEGQGQRLVANLCHLRSTAERANVLARMK